MVAVAAEEETVVDAGVKGTDNSELIEVGYGAAEIAALPMEDGLDVPSDSYFVRPVFDRRSQRAQKGNSHCQAY